MCLGIYHLAVCLHCKNDGTVRGPNKLFADEREVGHKLNMCGQRAMSGWCQYRDQRHAREIWFCLKDDSGRDKREYSLCGHWHEIKACAIGINQKEAALQSMLSSVMEDCKKRNDKPPKLVRRTAFKKHEQEPDYYDLKILGIDSLRSDAQQQDEMAEAKHKRERRTLQD